MHDLNITYMGCQALVKPAEVSDDYHTLVDSSHCHRCFAGLVSSASSGDPPSMRPRVGGVQLGDARIRSVPALYPLPNSQNSYDPPSFLICKVEGVMRMYLLCGYRLNTCGWTFIASGSGRRPNDASPCHGTCIRS